jgi:hypothetical protein
VDADRGVLGEHAQELLVALVELGAPVLLRQVDVAVHLPADHDRAAEKRLHRRVADREAVGPRVPRHVAQPQDLRMGDQLAEHAAAAGQVADHLARRLVDAHREEPRQAVALVVQDAERRVLRAGQLLRRREHPAQHFLELLDVEELVQDRDEAAGGRVHGRCTATLSGPDLAAKMNAGPGGQSSSRLCSIA